MTEVYLSYEKDMKIDCALVMIYDGSSDSQERVLLVALPAKDCYIKRYDKTYEYKSYLKEQKRGLDEST